MSTDDKRKNGEDTSATPGEAQDTAPAAAPEAAASSPDAGSTSTEDRPSLVDVLTANQGGEGEDLSDEDIFGLARGADPTTEETDSTGEQGSEAAAPAGEQADETETEAESEDTDEDTEQRAEGEDPDAELDQEDKPEDHSDLPFHQHPRFRKVVKERRKFRRQAQRYRTQVAALEGPAGEYGKIQNFMQEFSVKPEEMTELFQYRALLAHDPAQARELLYKQLTTLDARLGNTLPEDLQKDVTEGRMDAQTAQRLSKERASQAHAAHTARTEADNATATAQAQHVQNIGAAVDAWERATESSDPDYGRFKKQLVTDRLHAMRSQRGMPENPEVAVQWAAEALTEVNRLLGEVRGTGNGQAPDASGGARTAPIARNLSSDPGRSTGEIPAGPPQSMEEAVARGIAMTKG